MDPRLTNEPLIIAVHWTKTYVQSTLSWKWLSDSSRNLAIYIKSNNASWGKLQVTLSTFLATIMDVQTTRNTSTIPTITYLYQISPSSKDKKVENMYCNSNEDRLQNSPYFCVFKYARAVKQKVWNEAENRERDWGETLKEKQTVAFFLSPRTPYGCARLVLVRLLRHALPISLLILRKKSTVLQSTMKMAS